MPNLLQGWTLRNVVKCFPNWRASSETLNDLFHYQNLFVRPKAIRKWVIDLPACTAAVWHLFGTVEGRQNSHIIKQHTLLIITQIEWRAINWSDELEAQKTNYMQFMRWALSNPQYPNKKKPLTSAQRHQLGVNLHFWAGKRWRYK